MHLVIRAAFIYLFVFLILRISGKRQFSEITTFDFVLVLILSEAVSQGLYGGDDFSLTSSVLLVSTFVALDVIFSFVKQKFPKVDKAMEGVPVLLLDDGQVIEKHLKAERIDEGDILEAARSNFGIQSLDQIKYAILERNGSISVVPRAGSTVS
jgi:uncharacterized membrane protein YcaP (DUF421 family)